MSTNYIREDQVRVTFRGFVIAHIEEGSPWAEMGALTPRPPQVTRCHQPRIHVYRTDVANEEIQEIFSVQAPNNDFKVVTYKDGKRIRKYQGDQNPDFDPTDPYNRNDPKDFRWFVNLNKIHGLPSDGPAANRISIIPNRQSPMFCMDDGLFITSGLSDAEANRQVLSQPQSEYEFGKFAREITAKVSLRPGERAEFCYGDDTKFTVNYGDGFLYDIDFDCRCLINDDESDFHLVYEAIELPKDVPRVDLVRRPRGDVVFEISPEVYCGGGTYP